MNKVYLLTCLISLFSHQLYAEDRVKCYASGSSASVLEEPGAVIPALTAVPLNTRHWLAMKASMDAYILPDLDENLTGEAFVQRFEAFYSHPIQGYRHWGYSSDRATGLKYIVLEPLYPREPWIFAFAGTQSTMDLYTDLEMGRAQVKVIEKFVMEFLDCGTVDRHGQPLAGQNWLVTGHSLGGGMAQIFAYLTQNLRTLMRMTPNRVELVTFNGFGARDIVLGGGDFADLVMPGVLAYNYFVTSDVVSKIGTHLGPTYELPMADAGANPGEILNRHMLSTVEGLVANYNGGFEIAVEAKPNYSEPLNALKGAGKWLGTLVEDRRDNLTEQLKQRNLLFAAANVLLERRFSGSLDYLTADFIIRSADDLKRDIEAQSQNDLRDELIAELQQLITTLQNK